MDLIKDSKGKVIAEVKDIDYPLKMEVEQPKGIGYYITHKYPSGGICTAKDNTTTTFKNVSVKYILDNS